MGEHNKQNPENKTIADAIDKGDVLSGHRTLVTARTYRADFIGIFDIKTETSIPDERIDVYIVDVILGIAYYTKKIEKARTERCRYIIISGILIVLIPVLLALLSTKPLGLDGASAIAQIVGGLTAIAGLQKIIAAGLPPISAT